MDKTDWLSRYRERHGTTGSSIENGSGFQNPRVFVEDIVNQKLLGGSSERWVDFVHYGA